jgi:hypothetical protein
MNRRKFLVATAAITSALCVPRRAAAADKAHTTRALGEGEGVLFDTDDNVIYTVNNDGGIDALELKTGKVRWTLPENDKRFYYPLAVIGDRLLTRARVREKVNDVPRIAIAQLSTRDGKEIRVSDTLAIPAFVQPFSWFETPPGGVDAYRARLRGGFWTAIATERIDGDTLILDWKAIKTVGKEVTFASFEEAQTQAATGSVVIDLAKGTVKAKDVDEKADLPKTIDAVKSRTTKDTKDFVVDKTIFRIEQKADTPMKFKFQRVLTAFAVENKEKPLWEHAVHGVLVPRR